MKTLKGNEMITIAYFIAILIVLFVVYKILGGLGLVKTAASKKKEASAEVLRTTEYFNPFLLDNKPAGYVFLGDSGEVFAKELRTAMRFPGTNEERIYSVFGRLKNRYNISEVALNYKWLYDRDLQVDLMDELTDKEQVILLDLINKLPRL